MAVQKSKPEPCHSSQLASTGWSQHFTKCQKKRENIDRAVLALCWLGKAFLRDYPGRQVCFLQTKAVQQIPVWSSSQSRQRSLKASKKTKARSWDVQLLIQSVSNMWVDLLRPGEPETPTLWTQRSKYWNISLRPCRISKIRKTNQWSTICWPLVSFHLSNPPSAGGKLLYKQEDEHWQENPGIELE